MALFILLIVALVVGQTWWDWRDVQRQSALPDWAGGAALAGMVAAAFTGVTSMGSVLYQHTVGELQTGFGSGLFWPELGFLLSSMVVIIAAVRKKGARALLLLAGVVAFALWLGIALYS